jgi:hypothetical protein
MWLYEPRINIIEWWFTLNTFGNNLHCNAMCVASDETKRLKQLIYNLGVSMNYETNRHFYKKYIKETFQSKVEEFDWELFVGDEIALNVFDTQKYKMAIKRENFFFFIIDKDELLQIIRMFSVTAPKLWDNKNNQKFHDAVKDKLTSIENARRLLEDFTKPINCNYDYKPRMKKIS